tara:strand:- start:1288 stop:1626 length:339 start_codon:yes stop_codon:yes gene_type:complete
MKKFLGTVIHIVLVFGTLLLCTSKLSSNQSKVEMIPYRLVPSGDVTCPMDIEIIQPLTMVGIPILYNDELEEIIMDRIVFEITNPFAQNEIFKIDDKFYYLLRVPYTGAIWK